MRCPNCNSKIENESDKCRYCDYIITDKKTDSDDLTIDREGQYNYSESYSKYAGLDSSKEKYIDSYIGNNRDIIDSKFNIFACIFGPIYLLYRNINIIGLFTLIIYLFLLKEPLILLIINLFLGFEFRKLYYNDMNNKIDKILSNNRDKSSSEIIELIKEKGNTNNSIKLIILVICYFLIIGMIIYIHNINVENKSKNKILLKEAFNRLDYKIPSNYKLVTNKSNYKTYSKSNNNHNCIFSVYSKKNKFYNSEINYIKVIDNINTVARINVNGNSWFHYKDDNKNIYVIKKDGYFYKIIFNTYKDKDKVCYKDNIELIHSLKFEGE